MSVAPLPAKGTSLSERELEVLRLVAQGLTNEQIGRRLTIAPDTVRSHMQRIRARLGQGGRAAVVRAGYETGWLRLPDEVVLEQAETILRQARLEKVRADLERQQASGRAA